MTIIKLRPGEWIDSGGNVREGQLSGKSRGMIMHSNIAEKAKIMNFKSKFPRELLNEIKWVCDGLSKCAIYYINRGSPDDMAIVNGGQIKEIDRGFLILEGIPYEIYIPYHRITKIEYNDQTVFERPEKK